MTLNTKNIIAIAGTAIMMGIGFAACKKDSTSTPTPTPAPTPAAYPKTVSIEYKLISTGGLDTAGSIVYTNESGGNSNAQNVKLPFTKTMTRTVKRYDNMGFGFSTYGAGSFRMTMSVDGTVVKDQTYSGTGAISGSLAYIFQ